MKKSKLLKIISLTLNSRKQTISQFADSHVNKETLSIHIRHLLPNPSMNAAKTITSNYKFFDQKVISIKAKFYNFLIAN